MNKEIVSLSENIVKIYGKTADKNRLEYFENCNDEDSYSNIILSVIEGVKAEGEVYRNLLLEKEYQKIFDISCKIEQLLDIYENIKGKYIYDACYSISTYIDELPVDVDKYNYIYNQMNLGTFLRKCYEVINDFYIELSFLGFDEKNLYNSYQRIELEKIIYAIYKKDEQYKKMIIENINKISNLIYKINKMDTYYESCPAYNLYLPVEDEIEFNHIRYFQYEIGSMVEKYDKYILDNSLECKPLSELILENKE